jgi:fatty acid desaturase
MLSNAMISTNLDSLPANPRQILSADDLAQLNQRSDWAGGLHFLGHLGLIAVSGILWMQGPLWLAIPALVIYGASLALMFCAMHECCHRTAFEQPRLNDAAAWIAGVLSFYNSTFYRRYHKWHHRYTQIPGKDPELDYPKPTNGFEYIRHLSGLPWWISKVQGHVSVALGRLEGCYFLPESSHREVILSTRWQLTVYLLVAGVGVLLGHPWLLLKLWILPLAVGQPLLRFVLLAEHTGCPNDEDPLDNTRTTLTLAPLRWMMWNMPFHAEHHLYPSIPFQALPQAHETLKPYFRRVEPGYLRVHRDLLELLAKQGA